MSRALQRARGWRRAGLASAAVLGLVCAGAYLTLWASLPRLSGTLPMAGLGAEVEILRDAQAVPHVYAQHELDAYQALGYLHAQDRLWQLELSRRAAAGRLAELFGEAALPHDRLMRSLGLAQLASASFDRLDAGTARVLQAYTRGVNALLAEQRPRPPELLLLGVRPEPWAPSDSLLLLELMAWELSGQLDRELLRAQLVTKLGAAKASLVVPGIPKNLGALGQNLELNTTAVRGLLAARGAAGKSALGSNSWAVAKRRSTTGAPLLANDPHLELSAPGAFYIVHLDAPSLHVVGASLPGIPGVILGQNEHVAWSFTNFRADTQDLFLERLSPTSAEHYDTPDGPARFEVRRERIRVRGAADEVLEVRSTRHGPVISDVVPEARAGISPGYVLALQFTALAVDTQSVGFALAAAHARDSAQLLTAARGLLSPPQAIVVADDAGAIAFAAAGRVPRRAADNELRGQLPMPGWDARYDWQGYLAFEELPEVTDPLSGRIVTANNDLAPLGYAQHLSVDWASPARAERIANQLDARSVHDVASMERLQSDVHSAQATRLLPLLISQLPAPRAPLAAALARWNGDFERTAFEPAFIARWLRELGRLVFADELADQLPALWGQTFELLEDVLRARAGRDQFCDDVRTEAQESCALQVSRAFDAARGGRTDAEVKTERWGQLHTARFEHAAFGGIFPLSLLWNVEVPSGGASDTVNLGEYAVEDEAAPFVSRYGPVYRAVYDLRDPERSVFMAGPGQSGHPLSKHYRHWAGAWARGELLHVSRARARIEATAIGHLRLRPDPSGRAHGAAHQ